MGGRYLVLVWFGDFGLLVDCLFGCCLALYLYGGMVVLVAWFGWYLWMAWLAWVVGFVCALLLAVVD